MKSVTTYSTTQNMASVDSDIPSSCLRLTKVDIITLVILGSIICVLLTIITILLVRGHRLRPSLPPFDGNFDPEHIRRLSRSRQEVHASWNVSESSHPVHLDSHSRIQSVMVDPIGTNAPDADGDQLYIHAPSQPNRESSRSINTEGRQTFPGNDPVKTAETPSSLGLDLYNIGQHFRAVVEHQTLP